MTILLNTNNRSGFELSVEHFCQLTVIAVHNLSVWTAFLSPVYGLCSGMTKIKTQLLKVDTVDREWISIEIGRMVSVSFGGGAHLTMDN